MDRKIVSSSNIRSIGYDPLTSILEIGFNDESIYRYSGVPSGIHQALMDADSHGKYFSQNIKSVYPYSRVN